MLKNLIFATLLTASTASAYSARLLRADDGAMPGDAPTAPDSTPTPNPAAPPDEAATVAPAAVSLTPSAAGTLANARPVSTWLLRGATAGVGIVSVPLSLWFTGVIGSLSNDLIATAIPSLLVMGLLAPTITALLSWVIANLNMPESQRVGFWLPYLGSIVVHCVLLTIGGFLGLSVGAPGGLILFSFIDGIAMAFATTGIQQLAGRSEKAMVKLETHAPGESTMNVVPVSQLAF